MPLLSLSVVDATQQKLESITTSSAKNKWIDKVEEGEFIKFKKSGVSQKRVDVTFESFTKECEGYLNGFRFESCHP